MEEKNLIELLEKTSIPEIEISSHKRKLREILLSKYPREKRNWVVFSIFQKIIPIGIAIILIFFTINNLIYPTYNLAKAKEIALKDPKIKELIEEGGMIKDVKIIKNRAYVLIQSVGEEIIKEPQIAEKETLGIQKIEEVKKEVAPVALAEISIKEERVTKIEKITPPIFPLTEEEKEKIKEIVQNNPEINKVTPQEVRILNIKNLQPQLELIKRGDSVQVILEAESEKKASIIFQAGKGRWEGMVNLSTEKVEQVKFLEEIKNGATLPE